MVVINIFLLHLPLFLLLPFPPPLSFLLLDESLELDGDWDLPPLLFLLLDGGNIVGIAVGTSSQNVCPVLRCLRCLDCDFESGAGLSAAETTQCFKKNAHERIFKRVMVVFDIFLMI